MNIIQSVEKKRGCGYRKKGGIYLMGGSLGAPCCKLPFELSVCPCCSSGIKPTRGFTWITTQLFEGQKCTSERSNSCIMNTARVRLGLLWIGEKFYKTPDDFIRESETQGISRRIAQVPRDFKVGETWIALAHRKAIEYTEENEKKFKAGIFQMFKPYRIDYVVKGDETDEELERMEKRGFTLIDVIPDNEIYREYAC